MKCLNCNKEIPNESDFCAFCGNPINKESFSNGQSNKKITTLLIIISILIIIVSLVVFITNFEWVFNQIMKNIVYIFSKFI